MTNQPALRVKSYFALSVDAAIAQAREELGPEALLLNTRKLPKDGDQSASYEVVFGVAGEAAPWPAPTQAPSREIRALSTESRYDSRLDGKASPKESRTVLHESRSEPNVGSHAEPRNELRQEQTPARYAGSPKPAEPRAASLARREQTSPSSDDVAGELERLHAQIDEIRSLLVRSSTPQITIGRTVPELADVYGRLMSSGVDAAISND